MTWGRTRVIYFDGVKTVSEVDMEKPAAAPADCWLSLLRWPCPPASLRKNLRPAASGPRLRE